MAALLTAALAAAPVLAAQVAQAPAFTYRIGPQGSGFYSTATAPRAAATQPRAAATTSGRTVGPGARNWSTGNRVGLHRPWLQSRR